MFRLSPTLLLLAACGGTDDTGTPATDPRWEATLAELQPWADDLGVPGVGIAIVEDGAVTHSGGVGVRSLATGEPVTGDTLFRSSSTASKTLIAATLLDLAEDGLVDLATPIADLAPAVQLDPAYADAIDLDTMLAMRSGADVVSFRTWCGAGDPSVLGYFAETGPVASVAAPGDVWMYSALPATAGAAVIETVTGRPFQDVVAERLLAPSGAAGATYDPAVAVAVDHAVGHYDDRDEDLDEILAAGCGEYQASGGLLASAADHARVLTTFLAAGPLEQASVELLNEAHTSPGFGEGWTYGYQAFGLDYKGVRVMHHYGTNDGYAGGMSWVPDRGFGVVLLVNRAADLALTWALEAERWAILDRFLELTGDPPDPSTSPDTWTRYVGTYLDPRLPELSLVVEDDGTGAVVARFLPDAGTAMPLVQGGLDAPYEGGDVFHFEDDAHFFLVAFYPDAAGAIRHVVLYTDVDLDGAYYFVGERQDG